MDIDELRIVDVENILSNVPDHFAVVFQHVDGYKLTYSNVSHGSLDTIIFLETFNAPTIVQDLELVTSQVPEDRYISFCCSNKRLVLTNYEYNKTFITLFFKDEQ